MEVRLDQLASGQCSQLLILALKIRHPDVGQPLQPRSKWTLGAPGPPGDTTQFPFISGKKANDQVRFPEGVRAQDERFADPRGHRFDANVQGSTKTEVRRQKSEVHF